MKPRLPDRAVDLAPPGAAPDGRWIVGFAVLACLGVLAFASLAGAAHPWKWLGVNQFRPAFGDLHNLMSGADCASRGLDPLRENPCDVLRRPVNYPRVWLLLVPSGLDPGGRLVLGTAMALAILAAYLAFLGRLTVREGIPTALLLVSPAITLLLERGNIDGWVLVLCLTAAVLLGKSGELRRDLGVAVVLVAAVLKLFPAVILPALLLPRLRDARNHARVLAAAAVFVGYLWATRDDVRLILAAVPQSGMHSYGANVWPKRMLAASGLDLRPWYAVAAGTVFAAGAWAARSGRRLLPGLAESRAGAAFVGGAAVYVSTFAFGANWAYRLAFLLLLVPQLVAWGRERGPERRLAGAGWALALLSTYCLLAPFGSPVFTRASLMLAGAGDVASWLLALLLAAQLGATAGGPPVPSGARNAGAGDDQA